MEHEFNNRISAQRELLKVINRKSWPAEDLFGLSAKAIDRWVRANQLNPKAALVSMVVAVSDQLFFLANRSQEQISEQYQLVRSEIAAACHNIERELSLSPE